MAKKAGVRKKSREDLELLNIRTSKFIGYCPGCYSMISDKDKVSKQIFECYSCKLRARIKYLLKDKEPICLSKREYLEDVLRVNYHDMPEMNPIVDNFKVSWD